MFIELLNNFIADSYSQGLRRLKESFIKDCIESSSQNDSDTVQKRRTDSNKDLNELPVKLAPNAANQVFNDVPEFSQSLTEQHEKGNISFMDIKIIYESFQTFFCNERKQYY